jgi:RHS repeat-associated protein
VNDTLKEGTEIVSLTIGASGSYTGSGSPAEVSIYDNEYESKHSNSLGCNCNCQCECECTTHGTVDVDVNASSGVAVLGLAGTPPVSTGMDQHQGPQLKYHDDQNPHLVLHAQDVLPDSSGDMPSRIKIELTLNGNSYGPFYYDASSTNVGQAVNYALPVSLSESTGRYKWTMNVYYQDGSGNNLTGGPHRTFTGEQDVVNRSGSEFGKRWWLEDLDQLIVQSSDNSNTPDGVLLVKGNGDSVWFDLDGGAYTREAGDMNFSTIAKDTPVSGQYTIKTKYGDSSIFDSSGKLIARIDRNGNATEFTYNGSDKIDTITDPYDYTTTFAYDGNGKLATITDYANRQTAYSVVSGQLLSVTQPDPDTGDGVSTPQIVFDYDDVIETITDINGNVTSLTHDATTNRVTSLTKPGSTAINYAPFDNRGLAVTTYSSSVDVLPVGHADSKGSVTDELGNARFITTDRFGNPLTDQDDLGRVTRYYRNQDGQPLKMFEPDVPGIGAPITTYTYSSNGNLTQIDYPDGASEEWTYDSTWNKPATHTDQRDKVTTYTFDAHGNLIEDRQEMTSGSDLVTAYTYTSGAGSHLEFDGTDDRVEMGDQDDLKIHTSDFTAAMWIKPDTVTNYTIALGQGNPFNDSGEGYDLAYRADLTPAKLQFRINDGQTLAQVVDFAVGNVTGAWHHIAVTVQNSGNIVLYLDGVSLVSTANARSADVAGTRGFVVGSLPGTGSTWYDGFVDDVRIYHDALTQPQIETVRTGAALGTETAQWRFDEAAGTVAYDFTSNHLDGTIKSNGIATSALWRRTDGPPIVPGGLTTKITGPNGHATDYDYYHFANVSSLTDLRRGLIRTITYPDPDGADPLPAPRTAFLYAYDPGTTKQLTSFKSIETTTDDTTWDTGTYADRRTTEQQFDLMGRVTKSIDPDPDDGGSDTFGSLKSQVVAYKYDANGNRIKMSETTVDDSDPFSSTDRVTQFQYDEQNRIVRTTYPDPDGTDSLPSRVIAHQYDDAGNLTAMAETTTGDTDPFTGSWTDRRLTTYVVDELNRLVVVTAPDPDGGGLLPAPVTAFVYDALGHLSSYIETTADDSSPTDINSAHEDKRVTRYFYDALGRQIKVISPDPDGIPTGYIGALPSVVTAYEYDEAGNIERQIETNSTDTTPFSATQTSMRRITAYSYDDAGRLEKVVLPDPDPGAAGGGLPSPVQVPKYDLASNLIQFITTTTADGAPLDPESADDDKRITTYEYDALDRLIRTTLPDPDRGDPLPAPVEVTVYDARGNVEQSLQTSDDDDFSGASHPDRRGMTYEYDQLGRVLSETAPDPDGEGPQDGALTEYEYGSIGDLTAVTDARGGVTEFAYDLTHRQTQITHPDPDSGGSGLARMVTAYVYDAVGDLVHEIETTTADTEIFDIEIDSGDYIDKHVTTHEYDAAHRVTSTTLPDPDLDRDSGDENPLASPVWTYYYDDFGNQNSIYSPIGGSVTYTFDRLNRQISAYQPDPDSTGPETSAISYTAYDDNGDVASTIDGRGNATSYTYDNLHRQTKIVQPDPDAAATLHSPVTAYVYNSVGDLVYSVETTAADADIFDVDGTHSYQYKRITAMEYDDLHRQVSVAAPDLDGSGTDVSPRVQRTTYDARGRVIANTEYAYNAVESAFTPNRITTYDYDRADRLRATSIPAVMTIAAGVRSDYFIPDTGPEFDDFPEFNALTPVKTRYATSIDYTTSGDFINDVGESYSDDFAVVWNGAFTSSTGNYVFTTPHVDNGDDDDRRLYIDGQLILPENEDQAAPLALLAGLHSIRLEYFKHDSGDGIQLQYSFNSGAAATLPITSSPVRNGISLDEAGDTIGTTDPNNRVTTYQHDNLGRVTGVIQPDPDGAPGGDDPAALYTHYNDIGDVAYQEDALSQQTVFTYDNLHRMTAKLDPDNTEPTEYQYDAAGNLKQLEDPDDNATDYVYDLWGRLTQETITPTAGAKSRSYLYDANGNLTKKTDRTGRVTEYTYDALDRRTRELWKTSGGSTVRSIDYAFEDRGFLASLSENDGNPSNLLYNYDYEYDQWGRNTSATYDYKGSLASGVGHVGSGSTHFTTQVTMDTNYLAFGPRSLLSVGTVDGGTPTGDSAVSSIVNNAGYVTYQGQLQVSGGPTINQKNIFRYIDLADQSGKTRELVASGTQTIERYNTYDGAGRLTHIRYTPVGGATTYTQFAYAYDAANRVTTLRVNHANTDPLPDALSANAENADYDYDGRGNQLTDVDRNGTDESYTYDEAGNRDGTTGEYNRLDDDGTYTYTYDDEGNLHTRTIDGTPNHDKNDYLELEWDHRNRLTTVTHKSITSGVYTTVDVISYDYDAFDRRIHKSVDLASVGGTTSDRDEFYFFDGTNPYLDFIDADGQGTGVGVTRDKRYFYGEGVDELYAIEDLTKSSTASDRTLRAVTDNLGTVRELIDKAGTSVTTFSYDAFGKLTAGDATKSRILYTGQEYDADTGIYNYNARWYDPGAGKFLSEDPSGLGPDANVYRYVGNNSTNATDPTGTVDAQVVTPALSDEEARSRALIEQTLIELKIEEHNKYIKEIMLATTSCTRGVGPTIHIISAPRSDGLGMVSGYLHDKAEEGQDEHTVVGALQSMAAGTLVGPTALFDTVPGAMMESAAESRRQIQKNLEDPKANAIDRSAARVALVVNHCGEGFAIYGLGEAQATLLGAPFILKGGAPGSTPTMPKLGLASESRLLSGQVEGRATQIADPKLISSLEQRGYKFFQDSETQRLLDYFKANASTDLAKNISLRPGARHVEVLEEYLHNVMNTKCMYKGLNIAEQEILTKEWMIRHKGLLRILGEDAAWLQKSADMYKK